MKGTSDPGLKDDFDILNEILADLVPKVCNKISRVSPILAILDKAFFFLDEAFVSFSIEIAREGLRNACALAKAQKSAAELVSGTADFAHAVTRPAWPLRCVLFVIRLFETRDPDRGYAVLLSRS